MLTKREVEQLFSRDNINRHLSEQHEWEQIPQTISSMRIISSRGSANIIHFHVIRKRRTIHEIILLSKEIVVLKNIVVYRHL